MIPNEYKRCENSKCLYRLKKNKRKWLEENIEPNYGKTVYIYSHISEKFIEKTINKNLPISIFIKYLNLKILYIKI